MFSLTMAHFYPKTVLRSPISPLLIVHPHPFGMPHFTQINFALLLDYILRIQSVFFWGDCGHRERGERVIVRKEVHLL